MSIADPHSVVSSLLSSCSADNWRMLRRRARIGCIHLRDHFRSCVRDCRSFAYGALFASCCFMAPRVSVFCWRLHRRWQIRQLMSRHHAEAGMCVVPSTGNYNNYNNKDHILMLQKTGFCIGYSISKRSPAWVSYYMCDQYSSSSASRSSPSSLLSSSLFSLLRPRRSRNSNDAVSQEQHSKKTKTRKKRRSLLLLSTFLRGTGAASHSPQKQRTSLRLDFRADSDIPSEYRVTQEQFVCKLKQLSGQFERGHLVPAATASSFCDDATLNSMMHDCALLSAVALQHSSVNRGSWHRLEKLTRLWATRPLPSRSNFSVFSKYPLYYYSPRPSPIAVACGPIFSSASSDLSSSSSSSSSSFSATFPLVPTAFWLAVLHCHTGNAIAFEITNDYRGGIAPLVNCVLSLDALEKRHRLSLFRAMPWRRSPWPWQRKKVDLLFWRGQQRYPAAVSSVAATQSKNKGKKVLREQTTPQSLLLDARSK